MQTEPTRRTRTRAPADADVVRTIEKENFTLPQFFAAFAVPRTTFYALVKKGLAPRTMRIGTRVLINRKAADEWVARMEALNASSALESELA